MSTKGFTLIEIIIVIVILGVLATLALPKITNQLEAANASEAISTLGAIRTAAGSCHDLQNDYALCNEKSEIGLTIPGDAKFSYAQSATASLLRIKATKGTNSIYICMTSDGSSSYSHAPADTTNPYYGIVNKTNKLNSTCLTTGTFISM